MRQSREVGRFIAMQDGAGHWWVQKIMAPKVNSTEPRFAFWCQAASESKAFYIAMALNGELLTEATP